MMGVGRTSEPDEPQYLSGSERKSAQAGATLWTRSTGAESADSQDRWHHAMRCTRPASTTRAKLARPGLLRPHPPVIEVMSGGRWDAFDVVTRV